MNQMTLIYYIIILSLNAGKIVPKGSKENMTDVGNSMHHFSFTGISGE